MTFTEIFELIPYIGIDYSDSLMNHVMDFLRNCPISELQRRDEYGNKVAFYIAQAGNFVALAAIMSRDDVDKFHDVFYSLGGKNEDFISFHNDTLAVVNKDHLFYASCFGYWLNFFEKKGCLSSSEVAQIIENQDPTVIQAYIDAA
jgi:hypothetical protein